MAKKKAAIPVEWEVYYANGATYDSTKYAWKDIPRADVLIVRVWGDPKYGNWVNWGDSVYGEPGSWVNGIEIETTEFERILKIAQENAVPPSQRNE